MHAHVLACSLLCDPNSPDGLNGFGHFLVDAFFVCCGLSLLAGILMLPARIAEDRERKRRGLPPEPATDMSPFMAALISGRRVAAYTYPVRAVTPAGIPVRYGQCCVWGHQSPAQAVRHAEQVAWRIAGTGR